MLVASVRIAGSHVASSSRPYGPLQGDRGGRGIVDSLRCRANNKATKAYQSPYANLDGSWVSAADDRVMRADV